MYLNWWNYNDFRKCDIARKDNSANKKTGFERMGKINSGYHTIKRFLREAY
jgi:hypothetical protein